jgi:TfoX/Sxy family transcriptional regulator of competence genes
MSEYVEYVKEVLEHFGAIRVRRMFGGYGVYHEDLMFGLIADDVWYLKADDESVKWCRDKGLARFQYVKKLTHRHESYKLQAWLNDCRSFYRIPNTGKLNASPVHGTCRLLNGFVRH